MNPLWLLALLPILMGDAGGDIIKGLLAKAGWSPELDLLKAQAKMRAEAQEKTTTATMAAAEQQAGLNRKDQLQQMLDALEARGLAGDLEGTQQQSGIRRAMVGPAMRLGQGGANVLALAQVGRPQVSAQVGNRRPQVAELLARG
jgi:hypothetical protein